LTKTGHHPDHIGEATGHHGKCTRLPATRLVKQFAPTSKCLGFD
jgi:hypothetical protein